MNICKMLPPRFLTVICLLLSGVVCFASASNELQFVGEGCSLTEPVYGYKFDFTSLRSDMSRTATNDKGDETIEFNICGNIMKSCQGTNEVQACLKRDNQEYILGKASKPYYDNGKMFFKFTNGSKCGNEDYELRVYIACDYIMDKNQSKITSDANNVCSFNVTLETEHACLPQPEALKSNDCSVKNESHQTYDLLPLSDANYRTKNRKGGEFVINICKPVLYDQNAMCPMGSSVCFIDNNENNYTKKFRDYGSATSKPIIENGKLLMRHTSQTPCNEQQNYSSIIYFDCNFDDGKQNAQNRVQYTGANNDGCELKFNFSTPLACADCQAKSHGKEIIDLRTLKDTIFTTQQSDKNYTVAVCSKVNKGCADGDGACLTESGKQSTTSLGRANSNLRLDQTGTLYLLYENGGKCDGSNNGSWSTKVEFVCADKIIKDDSSNSNSVKTTLIENSNCQVLLEIQTPTACHEPISCKSDKHDLTPLRSVGENYEAQIDRSTITEQQVAKSTKFFLNVCRPIVPKFGFACHGAYAACMTTIDSTVPQETKSLGLPETEPVSENDNTVSLGYFNGEVCATDPKEIVSTKIVFNCDKKAGRGIPVLKNITDCLYIFNWATNVVCLPHEDKFNKNTCEITNDESKEVFDLRKIPISDKGNMKFDKLGFNLCDEQLKVVSNYQQTAVNVSLTTKADWCANAKANVQMEIICSKETKHTEIFTDQQKCNLLMKQELPEICKYLGITEPTVESSSTTTTTKTITTTTVATTTTLTTGIDTKHPAEQTASIGTILAAILSLTFFVTCIGALAFSPGRRNAIRRLFRRGTTAVRYSRVRSRQEANLLLEPNGEFTDTDDDMLL